MKREFSAGGVLVRRLRGRWVFAAIRPAGKKPGVWALPKGLIGRGEKPEETALREVAEETVKPKDLEESIVTNLQKVRVDEEDETEELASLSEAAEALRLTAAAPPRPSPSGGDYE